jgi:hypothetical protein
MRVPNLPDWAWTTFLNEVTRDWQSARPSVFWEDESGAYTEHAASAEVLDVLREKGTTVGVVHIGYGQCRGTFPVTA